MISFISPISYTIAYTITNHTFTCVCIFYHSHSISFINDSTSFIYLICRYKNYITNILIYDGSFSSGLEISLEFSDANEQYENMCEETYVGIQLQHGI